jgi:hypothetical protein
MKTTFVPLGAALLLATTAFAGPEQIIKQRAKELNEQNNVRQGVAPPTQPAAATSSAAAPAATSPNITRLQADLAALKTSSDITAEQKQKLSRDLAAAAETAAKPSAAGTKKLADDLSAAFGEKPLPAPSRARLVQELDAVLNPSRYPQAKLEGIFGDIQAIFQENGLTRKDAVAIADDVKAIAAEVRK